MKAEFNDTLLIKFFLKKTTEEENRSIYEWLAFSPKNKKEFARLQLIWNFSAMKYLNRHIDTEKDLQQIKTRIYRRKARWEKIRTIAYTAVSTAAVVASVLWFATPESSPVSPSGQTASRSDETEIFIPKGLEGNITLADGSKVWLNSGSRITYPKDYSAENRKLFLDGEAYFEIKTDKAHPFVVETSKVSVLVTGTRFNLSSYPDDNTVETTLCQGSVTLRRHDAQKEIHLKPNDKVTYHKDNGAIQKEIVDSRVAIAWKDGILSFKEVPLREIIKKLERKFNTTIRIQDPQIGEYTYTATFEKEKGLKAILDIIVTSAPIIYRQEQDGSITLLLT